MPGLLNKRSTVLHLEFQSTVPLFPFGYNVPSTKTIIDQLLFDGCISKKVPGPSSMRILFGEWTIGVGDADRESLFAEARAVSNVSVKAEPERLRKS